ncbi:MAG: serine/threonine protein kinase [Myxococcales bacterium]|nr:serine/threonine protein kinase [Myxococcales bacterium]
MEAPDIEVGTIVAETYQVTRLIGRGGMGAVWEAKHLRLPGKRVAVKVLLGGAAIDREAFARFRREAEIASQIGHPNIIEVHDFNTLATGTPYLVLEFLDGEDLAARIERGPIPLAEALSLVRQIGSALAAAHRADVVHRDLKPANIFLCPSDVGGVLADRVKVLDFGISKIRNSQTVQTQDSILLGTPQYMSPEQASGKNQELDQRTDVFALGSIVHEMLSGKPTFHGENLVAVIFKVVYEAAPSLAALVPSLPKEVVAAVERALAKDPAARFQDVASFVAALTGSPLQTLDRKAVPKPRPAGGGREEGFAATAAGVGLQATAAGQTAPDSLRLSSAKGEVVPATRQGDAAPDAPWRWRNAVFGAALVVTAGASYGIIRVITGGGGATAAVPVAMTVAHDAALAVAPPDLAAPIHPPPPDLALPGVPLPSPLPGTTRRAPVAAAAHEAIPPELAADLEEAELALAGGDTANAIHVARRTLNSRKTARAFSIIARAYCKAGDLGNAKATLLSFKGDRGPILRACKAAGVDLD